MLFYPYIKSFLRAHRLEKLKYLLFKKQHLFLLVSLQLLTALTDLQSVGVSHTHVTPQNIMVVNKEEML